MSSRTWTRDELSSSFVSLAGEAWRLVEAQHVASTMKLTDTAEDQAILERLIEETKPKIPAECAHLHFLLSAPFRYRPYPGGSRFRRAGMTLGVFYASEAFETAVAELAFYRVLFYAESPNVAWPTNPGEYTGLCVRYRSESCIDLQRPPFDAHADVWTERTDYVGCQLMEEQCCAAGTELIRYRSARDPAAGSNLAVLTCHVFASPRPTRLESWKMHLGPTGVRAVREFPYQTLAFGPDAFADDPRLAAMRWDR